MYKLYRYIQILSNIALRRIRAGSGKVFGLPVHLQIEITNNCNLLCQSCHRDLLFPEVKSMSFDNFKKVFDSVKPLKVNVSGLGEPFMNPDVFKIIKYAKNFGSAVNCASNFTLVENKIEQIIESGIDQIKVSIDAAQKETFLKIRKKDLYDVLIKNLIKLNKIKEERGLEKPDIRFNFALQNDNIDELLDTIELAKSLKIKTIYIQNLIYIDRENRKNILVGDITYKKLKNLLLKAERLTNKYGIETNLGLWKTDFELLWANMQPTCGMSKNNKQCYFPWFTSWVNVDGTVRPCPTIPWRNNVAYMGNAFNENYSNIWNNKKYRDFRKALACGERPTGVCKACIPQSLSTIFQIGTKLLPK